MMTKTTMMNSLSTGVRRWTKRDKAVYRLRGQTRTGRDNDLDCPEMSKRQLSIFDLPDIADQGRGKENER